ncbi:hypothetical protein HC251_20485 [Iamia sp. SCSIO 61187]|uniref:hypothetical protein n=1 Tax=Iamia sp. SCSIO 61187 TaxID=2722752 RepID=UPI001C633B57|nr:hypothetical protein [Iamia sp. SCSIO 61187]QYG94575.1 hypothetical protein HC251_20485 [Iamia sp. SCSIO 61187]
MTASILAHGADGLAGDGVPTALLYGVVVAGAVVVALGLRARGTRPSGGPAVAPLTLDGAEGRAWPGDDAPAGARIAFHAVGVLGLVALLVVGWAGSDLSGLNALPSTLLSLWWAIPVLALLLGDWWLLVDPFDAVAAGIERVRPPTVATGGGEVDEAGDWWVPAALLASFAWMVTCWLDGQEPRNMALWLTALTGVMVVGAALGGRAWVRRSSPLAVLTGAVAAAAPVTWEGGRPRPRNPLAGLAGRAGGRRTAAVVLVVLGTAFWEAVSGTQWWADLVGTSGTGGTASSLVWSTVGLAWCILLAGAAWMGAGAAAEAVARSVGGPALDEPFGTDAVVALAPLAAVALAAHQLTTLLVTAQYAVLFHAADPFAEGWDLTGTRSWVPNEQVLSPTAASWVRLALLLVGLGLLLAGAWDRLAARVGRAVVTAGWVVAAFTAAVGSLALWLLLGA